ncbi:MAG: anaerobic ribonucleoside-triphosphate reductase activating protein [Clostridia bacterium]|nr:anaerobic ribonucleoside-triphosphate reductase activating protein [Clostridia bacterium]
MEILGIEKVSFVDYENKICATVFTGGCNFCCPFCHNGGLVKRTHKKIEESEILNYLKERKSLLDAVTISGGEPTLQRDLKEFVKKVKEMCYLVKLDTNGTNPQVVRELLDEKLIDYVAMDIKNNFDNYCGITGVSKNFSDKVEETLQILKDSKVEFELRTTLVKEFHSRENIEKIASELAGQNKLVLQKFVENENCLNFGLHEVEKKQAQEFQEILSKSIKNVSLRGY